MGSHYVVWLTIIFSYVLLIVDASATTSQRLFGFPNWASYYTVSETDVPTTRFLRADDDNDEERAGLAVSAFEKTKAKFTSSNLTPEKLQEKLASWLQEGKSADTVFMRLHLHNDRELLFQNRKFSAWVEYVDKLSAKNPTKGISAISTLTVQYGDEALYNVIKAAKNIPRLKDLATKLQTEQMQHWITTGKDPGDVFNLFNLDKAGEWIFSNPEFTAWVKYVDDFNAKYPEKPTSMYSTLTKYFRDDVLFKMNDAIKSAEGTGTKDIVTKLESEWMQAGLQNRKTPDKALLDLGLGKAADTLLESPLLNTWVRYMNAYNEVYVEKKMTMIEAFTHTFGDAGVTTMLHAAKTKGWTRDTASKLESAQLKMWLNSGKSTDDVFKLLKLDKEATSLRDKVLLNTWVSYINFFITENPDKKTTVLSALEARFSDRPLNKILNAANKFPSMENTATKVQTDKIQGYLVSKTSPKEVFKLLGLDDVGDHVLGTSVFQSWLHYVKVFNKQNPKQQEYWFDPLRWNCQWFEVEKMIDQALQNPLTVQIGKMVETAWLKFWLDRKDLPERAFHFLHLDKAGEQTLANPKFKTWAAYLNDFNQRYPDSKTTMIDGLRANYNDRALLRMFNVAKNDPDTEKLATNLQNALIDKWLTAGMKPEKLKWTLSDVVTSEEMIERYIKKLAATKNL